MAVDATVSIGMDTSQLNAGAKKAEGIVGKMSANIKSSFGGLGRELGGIFLGAGLVNFTKESVKAAIAMQNMDQYLSVVMGSSEAAAQEIERLREAAKNPGLDFKSAVKGSASIQAIGLSAKEARDFLVQLGNVSAITGLNSYEFTEIVDAITDMGSASEVSDEKIDRLTQRSALFAKTLKGTFGASTAKGIRELGYTADQVIKGLTYGLAELQRADPDSVANKLKNIVDQIDHASVKLGENLLPALGHTLDAFNRIAEETKIAWGGTEKVFETISAMMNGLPYKEALEITRKLRAEEESRALAAKEAAAAAEKQNLEKPKAYKISDSKAEDSAKNARKTFEAETRILELQNEGTRAAAKKAAEMERGLKVTQLTEQIMKQQNVSAAEALRLAERRVNAETPKSGKIQGFKQSSKNLDPFRGLEGNKNEGPSAWDKLQETTGAVDKLKVGRSPFDMLKGRGTPLDGKAKENAVEKAAPKDPATEKLSSMDQSLKTIAEAVK